MKNKILIALLCLVSIANASLIYMLWSQQKINSRDIGFLENKMDRLDVDALEKIRSDNKEFNSDDLCGGGTWQLPCD